jgi:uncharacterized damage-inducible protein DinB
MSSREQFLAQYDREHATTMRVLLAYPVDKLDLKPAPMLKSAKELAWLFVGERRLGQLVFADAFGKGGPPSGPRPEMPEAWNDILSALPVAHKAFGDTIRGMSDEQLNEHVKFFTSPRQLGDVTRMQFAWFLLHDEIHHRGQFSIYTRMAGGIVPSIYGPTHEEPWM